MISIVIPVKNGGERLRWCLEAINGQVTSDAVEVLIVDSGSNDGTQELSRSLGARVHEIPSSEFNHGGTRNLGAELSAGEIVVFTVQDALPVGEGWLESLTAPLREENALAATYARQIAYAGAPVHQRYYIDYRYGPTARIQRASDPSRLTVANTLFSDVSSAIRKSVLAEHPYADDIVTGEDLEWCGRVLLAGYEIAYVPEAVVRHSHDYTLAGAFKRYFDQGAAAHRSFMAMGRTTAGSVRGDGVRFVCDELQYLWQNGERRAIPYTLAHEITRYAGFQIGAHNRFVPSAVRARISGTAAYWDTERARTQSGA